MSLLVPISTGTRTGKATSKKQNSSKLAFIVLEDTDRVTFIREFLKAHNLDGEYSPGVHNSPSFKLWWTGRYEFLFPSDIIY
jgi:hypothetical protein